jgi:hypothetical protein
MTGMSQSRQDIVTRARPYGPAFGHSSSTCVRCRMVIRFHCDCCAVVIDRQTFASLNCDRECRLLQVSALANGPLT